MSRLLAVTHVSGPNPWPDPFTGTSISAVLTPRPLENSLERSDHPPPVFHLVGGGWSGRDRRWLSVDTRGRGGAVLPVRSAACVSDLRPAVRVRAPRDVPDRGGQLPGELRGSLRGKLSPFDIDGRSPGATDFTGPRGLPAKCDTRLRDSPSDRRQPMLQPLARAWTATRAAHPAGRLSLVTRWPWDPSSTIAPLLRDGGLLKDQFFKHGRRSEVGRIHVRWQKTCVGNPPSGRRHRNGEQ